MVIGVGRGSGQSVELGDVGFSPFEEVDGVIAKWSDLASTVEGAASGLNVAAQESGAGPGTGLAFEFAYELGVRGTALFLLFFEAFLLFVFTGLAFVFGAFGLDFLCAFEAVGEHLGDFGFYELAAIVIPGCTAGGVIVFLVDAHDTERAGRCGHDSRRLVEAVPLLAGEFLRRRFAGLFGVAFFNQEGHRFTVHE